MSGASPCATLLKNPPPLGVGSVNNLYTNPGDLVFSPFGGIFSEPYQAVKMGRRAVAIELKESYFDAGVNNMQMLDLEKNQMNIFDFMGDKNE